MVHPFTWLSPDAQIPLFFVFLVLTLLVSTALMRLGRPLQRAGAGIVAYELAGDLATAQRMRQQWGERGRLYAALNLGLDYLYLVLYPITIALGCVLVAEGQTAQGIFFSRVGILLAWAQFAAGLLDAVENYALIRLLLGADDERWPPLARGCALVKFGIVGLGLLYVLIGLVRVLL